MQLFDSNIIIYSAQPAYAWLRPYLLASGSYVSAIAVIETLGFHKLTPTDQLYFEALFPLLQELPISSSIIKLSTQLRQRRRMSLGDALTAATAIDSGLSELITRNTSDFQHLLSIQAFNPIDFPGAG